MSTYTIRIKKQIAQECCKRLHEQHPPFDRNSEKGHWPPSGTSRYFSSSHSKKHNQLRIMWTTIKAIFIISVWLKNNLFSILMYICQILCPSQSKMTNRISKCSFAFRKLSFENCLATSPELQPSVDSMFMINYWKRTGSVKPSDTNHTLFTVLCCTSSALKGGGANRRRSPLTLAITVPAAPRISEEFSAWCLPMTAFSTRTSSPSRSSTTCCEHSWFSVGDKTERPQTRQLGYLDTFSCKTM